MKRKAPGAEAYKLLYVRSGNQCAYPGCDHPIFNDDNVYVAELCHIKAARKGGARYDKSQTEEERSHEMNLLFLCHRHHKETNDEIKFSVTKMVEMKTNHESKFSESAKPLTEKMLQQIITESDIYWSILKSKLFDFEEFKMKPSYEKNIGGLFNELVETIQLINNYCNHCAQSDEEEVLMNDLNKLCQLTGWDFVKIKDVHYFENPFFNRNWEYHNIGNVNLFSRLRLTLSQLKVRVYEEMLKNNPQNLELKKELELYRKDFEDTNNSSYHVD